MTQYKDYSLAIFIREEAAQRVATDLYVEYGILPEVRPHYVRSEMQGYKIYVPIRNEATPEYAKLMGKYLTEEHYYDLLDIM